MNVLIKNLMLWIIFISNIICEYFFVEDDFSWKVKKDVKGKKVGNDYLKLLLMNLWFGDFMRWK